MQIAGLLSWTNLHEKSKEKSNAHKTISMQ